MASAQIHLKISCTDFAQEFDSSNLQLQQQQQHVANGAAGAATVAAPGALARWKASQTSVLEAAAAANACFKQASGCKEYSDHQGAAAGAMKLLQVAAAAAAAEPTSVLDLQTSPGRSCSSSTVSLSSQQSSLSSSSDDSSFPLQAAPGSQNCSTIAAAAAAQELHETKSYCNVKEESSANSGLLEEQLDSTSDIHHAAAALQQVDGALLQLQAAESHEFPSWMDDCMEEDAAAAAQCDDGAVHDMGANDDDMDFAAVVVPDMGFSEYGNLISSSSNNSSCCFEMSEENCFPSAIFVSDQDMLLQLSEPPALNWYPLVDELKTFFNPSSLSICNGSSGPLLHEAMSNDVVAVAPTAAANESSLSMMLTDHPQQQQQQQQLVSSSSTLNFFTGTTTLCGGTAAASQIQQLHELPQTPPEFMYVLQQQQQGCCCSSSQLNENFSNPQEFSNHMSTHGSLLLLEGAAGSGAQTMIAATNCDEGISAMRSSLCLLPGQQQQQQQQEARISSCCSWAAGTTATTSDHHEQQAVLQVVNVLPQQQQQQQQQEDVNGGLQLVHLLLGCAEAIHGCDFELARPTLCHLRAISSPYGDTMQRIAFHFAEALTDRLNNMLLQTSSSSSKSSYTTTTTTITAADQPAAAAGRSPCAPPPAACSSSSCSWPSVLESELAYQAFYQVLPFEKFAHFTGNQALLEAVANSDRVHVLDLDVGQGLQWPAFFQSLVSRPGGPPAQLRMTAVGADSHSLQQTGRRLTEFARTLGNFFAFQFHPVVADHIHVALNQRAGFIQLHSDETLVVNCSQVLHRSLVTAAASESPLQQTSSSKQSSKKKTSAAAAAVGGGRGGVGPAGGLENVLHMIRSMNPKLVSVIEVEANHHNSNFMSRFVETLHYYCALFDSLEATLPRDSPQRRDIENTTFASQIKQIVAVESEQEEEESQEEKKNKEEHSQAVTTIKQQQVLLLQGSSSSSSSESSESSSSCSCPQEAAVAGAAAAASSPPPPRRHMRSEHWQTHFQQAGFRVVPASSYAIEQAHQLLELYKLQQLQQQQQQASTQWLLQQQSQYSLCNAMPYKLAQDESSAVLTLGWHDTPIIAVSSWTIV